MQLLREKQIELKTNLETVFSAIALNAAEIKKTDEKYISFVSGFIHSLEFLNYKNEIELSINQFFKTLENNTEKFSSVMESYSHAIKNKDEIIDVFEHVETNFLLPSFYSVSEGHRKIKNLLQEITFLCQYDDILSQSFLSLEEILNIIDEIDSGSFPINKEQFLKLKVLFSSITVFIFDTLEDTLSLIESKLYRIGSILKNSASYLKTAADIIDKQKNRVFVHFHHIQTLFQSMDDTLKHENEKLAIISVLGECSFVEHFTKELYSISERLGFVNFNINMLLNKNVFNTILENTAILFDSVVPKTSDNVDNFDFNAIFLGKFRIKEHKEMLIDIFGGNSEEILDDNIEFF